MTEQEIAAIALRATTIPLRYALDMQALLAALHAATRERDVLRAELGRVREQVRGRDAEAEVTTTVGLWSGEPRVVRPCRICGGRTIRESGVCLSCAARAQAAS